LALLTPEALLQLLTEGGTGSLTQVGISPPQLESPNIGNLLRFGRNTEYSGRDFYILLPFASDEKTGYRLHLRVENWKLKLVGLRLPEAVQTTLVRKIEAGWLQLGGIIAQIAAEGCAVSVTDRKKSCPLGWAKRGVSDV
jgi:hypothetical protein